MNKYYDPPSDLNIYEIQVIGRGLMKELHDEVSAYVSLREGIRNYIAEDGHEMGPFKTRSLADIDKQHLGQFRNMYKVLCRFVMDPLPFDFFLLDLKDTDFNAQR